MITEIRRNARYQAEDDADLNLAEPVAAAAVSRGLREVLAEAEVFVGAMPPGKEGLLFLKNNELMRPDPANLAVYTEHAGRRGGYWPSSPEIGSAMVRDRSIDPS